MEEPTKVQPKLETGPEVGFTVGADAKVGKVFLDMEVETTPPIKVRVYFDPNEVGEFCANMINASMSLGNRKDVKPSRVVIPQRAGALAPVTKFPKK